MRYRNDYWGFELDLPPGWREPGFFRRLISFGRYALQGVHPEFFGPGGSSIKIAVGQHFSPIPSTENQRSKLEAIARRHGQDVIATSIMKVGEKSHATMMCQVPDVGVLKNYSLVFGTTEFLVTAQGDWQECDSIVKTFQITQKYCA